MLEIQDLHVGYGKKTILSQIDIEPLATGQVVSLLGANGCGKSTLLKSLAGLIAPKAGRILLDGVDLRQQNFEQRAQHVVYLPQSLPAAVHLRVFESVLVAANATLTPTQHSSADAQQIMALLERLSIEHLAMRFLDELSGGQKQLVGLAQALIRRPTLLLLDEPLSALDLNYQYHVMELLKEQTQRHQMLSVIVLHDLNVALQHSDQCLLLSQGQVHAQGPVAEVITAPHLANAYGVAARIEACSQRQLHVFIDGLTPQTEGLL